MKLVQQDLFIQFNRSHLMKASILKTLKYILTKIFAINTLLPEVAMLTDFTAAQKLPQVEIDLIITIKSLMPIYLRYPVMC